MAPKMFTSLFVTAAAILVLSAAVASAGAENPLCAKFVHKRMCNRLAGTATNKNEASVNAIKALLTLVKEVQGLEPVLKTSLTKAEPSTQKLITETCQGDLKKRIALLEKSLTAIQAKDTKTVVANLKVGAVDTCYPELEKSKKKGFDKSTPYLRKVASLSVEFTSALELVQ